MAVAVAGLVPPLWLGPVVLELELARVLEPGLVLLELARVLGSGLIRETWEEQLL